MALDTIAKLQLHQEMFRLTATATAELQDKVAREGFAFVPYDPGTIALAKAGEVYGSTFVRSEYIPDHWTHDGFELAEYLPGGMRGWQDIVVLRRIPSSI